MLQNAYFLAKIGADTTENEQHLAEILPKTGNYPTVPQECPDEVFGDVVNLGKCKGGTAADPNFDVQLAGEVRRSTPRRPSASIGQTLKGLFSAVSKPNFASKYALESSFSRPSITGWCLVFSEFIFNPSRG